MTNPMHNDLTAPAEIPDGSTIVHELLHRLGEQFGRGVDIRRMTTDEEQLLDHLESGASNTLETYADGIEVIGNLMAKTTEPMEVAEVVKLGGLLAEVGRTMGAMDFMKAELRFMLAHKKS